MSESLGTWLALILLAALTIVGMAMTTRIAGDAGAEIRDPSPPETRLPLADSPPLARAARGPIRVSLEFPPILSPDFPPPPPAPEFVAPDGRDDVRTA